MGVGMAEQAENLNPRGFAYVNLTLEQMRLLADAFPEEEELRQQYERARNVIAPDD
jgi:hypothetical protein